MGQIRKIICSLASIACLAQVGWAQPVNLLENPGFDANESTAVVGDDTGINFVSCGGATQAWPGWQAYALGGSPAAGISQFAVASSPDAISPPNIMTWTKNFASTTSGDTGLRRDCVSQVFEFGRVFSWGIWVRDTDATPTNFNLNYGALGGTPLQFFGFEGGANTYAASQQWEKYEATFTLRHPQQDENDWATFNTRITDAQGTLQYDSAFTYDVTQGNRMTNGGFENSNSRPLSWTVVSAGGRSITATIVNDASQGNNACRLAQTNTDGDGLMGKDGGGPGQVLPWFGANRMNLQFDLKDDPAIAAGETVEVQICAWQIALLESGDPKVEANLDGEHFIGCPFTQLFETGSGNYLHHDIDITSFPPETAWITVNFRIKDQNGDPVAGDVLIDDIQVIDLDSQPVSGCQSSWVHY